LKLRRNDLHPALHDNQETYLVVSIFLQIDQFANEILVF